MSTLYELTGQYLQLLDMAEDSDPEVFADTLECLEGELEEKADNYAKVIKILEGDVNSIDSEIKRLQERKKSISANVKRIKSNLENTMRVTGKTKFKTLLFSFGIQKNPASVSILDETNIPEEFWKPQDPVLDKTKLKDYLTLNGSTEYAELVQTEGLRIR